MSHGLISTLGAERLREAVGANDSLMASLAS
jgi:hypothetical protein